MFEYTMQLVVQYPSDRKCAHIAFLDVQAENGHEARELAKRTYEAKHPNFVVYLHHGVSDETSSPHILKRKHCK